MAEIIKLEHVIDREISKDYLDKIYLTPKDFEDVDRQIAWKKNISGSKIKTILSTPISLLAYYMGWISADELEQALRDIPRMNYYRDYGSIQEAIIVEMFNRGISNEYSDNPHATCLRDVMIDPSAAYKLRMEFAPNARDKTYVYQDKRTFFLDIPGVENSNLLMVNIDGYTTNMDGSIKSIVEIKTKSGVPGEDGLKTWDYFQMHQDQMVFYNKMLQATDGAWLLVDQATRGLKAHKIEQHEIDRRWKEIQPKIELFTKCYIAMLEETPDVEKIISIIDEIQEDDYKKEIIQKKDLIKLVHTYLGDGV